MNVNKSWDRFLNDFYGLGELQYLPPPSVRDDDGDDDGWLVELNEIVY